MEILVVARHSKDFDTGFAIQVALLHFFDKRTKLSEFGYSQETNGERHDILINNKTYSVIPLCHPRNAARLGAHSSNWADWHKAWVEKKTKLSE